MILENIGIIVDAVYISIAMGVFVIVYASGDQAPEFSPPVIFIISLIVSVLWIVCVPVLTIKKLLDS